MFKTGFIASVPSPKDYIYSAVAPLKAAFPRKHESSIIKVKNQGPYGTCVGFAGSYMKDSQELSNHPGSRYELSPAFLYSMCKEIDGLAPGTEGTTLKAAAQVLANVGICLESQLPYNTFGSHIITQEIIQAAEKFKVEAYAKIQTLDEIKSAILDHNAVMTAWLATESFTQSEKGFIGEPNGYILGGHAVAAIGWDDDLEHTFKNGKRYKGFLKIVNSWGADWGYKGYGYIPYDLLNWRTDLGMTFFMEAWSTVDIITPSDHSQHMTLWIGKKEAVVNGKMVQMDVAPTLDPVSQRTLVPLRFISENMGYKVNWDGTKKQIDIYK